jgi:hypothetical protein
MKRRVGILAGIFLTAGVLTSAGPAAAANLQLSFTFSKANGASLPGSSWAIYLTPRNMPALSSFVPPLLAQGTADGSGIATATLSSTAQSAINADAALDGAGVSNNLVSVFIRAVDPGQRWFFSVDWVMSISGSVSKSFNAPIDLTTTGFTPSSSFGPSDLVHVTSASCLSSQDPDIGGDPMVASLESASQVSTPPSDPAVGCDAQSVVNQAKRWERVASLHAAAGVKVGFCMSQGRETQTEVGLKIGTGAWVVGGSALEVQSRSFSNCVLADGPYHRGRYAAYRWYEWQYTDHGPVIYKWIADHWTGDLAKETKTALTQPAFQRTYAVVVSSGVISTQNENNHTFQGGVDIEGLGLSVQAGYSGITSMTWRPISGCSATRYVYGNGVDPTQADIVYSACT